MGFTKLPSYLRTMAIALHRNIVIGLVIAFILFVIPSVGASPMPPDPGGQAASAESREGNQSERSHGAKLTGWVETASRGIELQGTVIELERQNAAIADRSGDRRHRRSNVLRAEADEKGYFEFLSLAAGAYHLKAVREGFFSQPIHFEIPPGLEQAVLPEPLLLSPPAELEITVDPVFDFWSETWTFRLLRPDDDPARWTEVAKEKSDDSGRWKLTGLAPGQYSLSIEDSQGGKWLEEELELLPGPTSRFFAVAGARLLVRPDTSLPRYVATGIDGGFELVLDANDRLVDFMILAPGTGFNFVRWPVDPASPAGRDTEMVLRVTANRGDLVISSLGAEGSIVHSGVAIPMQSILKMLFEAGQVQGHPTGAIALRGAAPGTWSFCPGASPEHGCITRELAPNGEAHLY